MRWSERCILCSVLISAGCGAPSTAALGLDRTIRPPWIPRPNKSHPDFVYVTGTCRGIKQRFLARSCALIDAERQLRRATSDPNAKVRGNFVEDEHFERRPTAPGSSELGYDWWVLVAYPRPAASGARGAASQASTGERAEEQRLLELWRELDAEGRRALLLVLERLGRGRR